MELSTLVSGFAIGMQTADNRGPQATSFRSGRQYRPGIGPHSEDAAVDLVVSELKRFDPELYGSLKTRVPYPDSRQKCDLTWGADPAWAIEIKMARFSGDNGKPDDMAVKDILSPYEDDRSAVSDCSKLARSSLGIRKAILIYGFNDTRRPLVVIIDAFEVLAKALVCLGPRLQQSIGSLIHPVFSSGAVFAWEVLAESQSTTRLSDGV